jgi:hypothetical protein
MPNDKCKNNNAITNSSLQTQRQLGYAMLNEEVTELAR